MFFSDKVYNFTKLALIYRAQIFFMHLIIMKMTKYNSRTNIIFVEIHKNLYFSANFLFFNYGFICPKIIF